MQVNSPKQQAIIVALVVTLITLISAVVFYYIESPDYFIALALIGLVVFFTVFVFVFYLLNNFLFNKLKPIYKTIQSFHFSEDKLKQDLDDGDKNIIDEAQKDVIHWAKKKTNEIAQLRQLEKYRREFIGNVSHELKTPIFNIQGYISTLIDGGLEDPTINYLYLAKAEKSVNRMISIVNDLESISRLESGELKLDIKKFNIVKLIEDIFDELDKLAGDRKIKLKLHYDSSPIFVLADKFRITEVLNNLIVNSIKYGKKSGYVNITLKEMDDHMMVILEDNGIGISEEDLPRIFERFYRTDKSRSRELGGTGLGLSIVKHIIEAHKQTISVRSEVNKGTEFSFSLKKA